jgi:hypothetical protein
LGTAEEELAATFDENDQSDAAPPVPYVVVVTLEGADSDGVEAALAALRASEYAFALGSLQGVPPPFDPARDLNAP